MRITVYIMSDKARFLLEYEALCRKYKICVHACGCCGSPFLTKLAEDGAEENDPCSITPAGHIAHLLKESEDIT